MLACLKTLQSLEMGDLAYQTINELALKKKQINWKNPSHKGRKTILRKFTNVFFIFKIPGLETLEA